MPTQFISRLFLFTDVKRVVKANSVLLGFNGNSSLALITRCNTQHRLVKTSCFKPDRIKIRYLFEFSAIDNYNNPGRPHVVIKISMTNMCFILIRRTILLLLSVDCIFRKYRIPESLQCYEKKNTILLWC